MLKKKFNSNLSHLKDPGIFPLKIKCGRSLLLELWTITNPVLQPGDEQILWGLFFNCVAFLYIILRRETGCFSKYVWKTSNETCKLISNNLLNSLYADCWLIWVESEFEQDSWFTG